MKVKNLNYSSRKTKVLIKRIFAEMLSEKKELNKIAVTELCKRAEISRGTFYAHYDDIYAVAEDYENELIDTFFNSARLLGTQDISHFLDAIFEFIRRNNDNYRRLCESNDILFAGKKFSSIASRKLLELCLSDVRIVDRAYIETELEIFLEGLLCEYVKLCRGYSQKTLDDLYDYTKYWVKNFLLRRTAQAL